MFKKILVPLDGSKLAENALPIAFEIAAKNNGEVLLLQSLEQELIISPSVTGYATVRPVKNLVNRNEMALSYLTSLQNDYARFDVPISTEIEFKDASTAILDTADEELVDLIVMSTHGRSGIDRWLYGSVTERVMRHADVPVLAVRTSSFPQHILIPVDGSETSEAAIAPSLALATVFDAKVTLTHIQDPTEPLPVGELQNIAAVDAELAELIQVDFYRRGEAYLERLALKLQEKGVEIAVAYSSGNPANHIIDLADKNNCDLIGMTTHGRTGYRRFRYGSVTEKIIRKNNRAMLIVRSADW